MGTHPIFESDFDCLTEMGLTFGTLGTQFGKGGTSFVGDVRGRAAYGLSLTKYPVQDVLPKTEPAMYYKNALYLKDGAEILPFFVPRAWKNHATNGGVYFGAWRYAETRRRQYKIFGAVAFVWFLMVQANKDSKLNISWRGGDSIWYGKAAPSLHEDHVLAHSLGVMAK